MKYPALKIVGLMSGTSLDGLDIAACLFKENSGKWEYEVLQADTVEYSQELKSKLTSLMSASAMEISKAHFDLGYFYGEKVNDFLTQNNLKPDYIASHGHTIFHQPQVGFTTQIGHGACISAKCGFPVIYDFRALDVALGGQGAPLVPIGDKLLYSDYEFCLNLGGIANISYDDPEGRRIAFDICPINMILNSLSKEKGLEYDKDGMLARTGKLNKDLFNKLENLNFYTIPGPKSLGKEWVDKEVFPLINSYTISVEDKLNTFCHHVASQISKSFEVKEGKNKVLVTGGGAFNTFFIELLKERAGAKTEIVVPDAQTIMFKEAIVFAFLGYLRILKINNCLSSVTGASRDSCGGAVVES